MLPLQNINGDISVEFLRFALADEIANALTYTRTLDVRPSSVTRKYAAVDVDPQKAGRELHVATVITGHFLKQGDNLMVTLEAIDVRNDRLLWQTNFTAPAQDLIASAVDHGGPGASRVASRLGCRRRSARYRHSSQGPGGLRSLSAQPGLAARSRPEQGCDRGAGACGADAIPNYAPAWEELGLRCYYDATYSDGGEQMFQRSTQAYERALALDPNRILAAGQLITNRVERGELGKAYAGCAGAGQAPSGKCRGPLRDGVCLSLCRNAGAVRQ